VGVQFTGTPGHIDPYFNLGTHPVTNQEFLEAVQWAYDNGLVTATTSSVQAYYHELVNLDDPFCEISFNNGIFTLVQSMSNEAQSAYPSGYDPANHPVEEVSWYGAACYCDWRSQMENLTPFYDGNWFHNAEHDPSCNAGRKNELSKNQSL